MTDQRFVVTDALWKRLEDHLPGKASDAGATAKDNRLFLKAVFGASGQVHLGATCPLVSGNGTASSDASVAGPKPVFLIVFSMR